MIEPALIELLQKDRFYADILMRLHRVYNNSQVPTAAVSLERRGTLYINPQFWKDNDKYHVQILMHECMHLLFDHIGRSKEQGFGPLFNIAADLAINEMIPGFPDEIIMGGQKGFTATVNNYKKQFPLMEHNKSFEYYLEFLKGEADAQNGPGTMDDHSGWEKSNMTPEEARAVVRELVEKATQSTKYAGKEVPPQLRPYLEKLFDSGISWEEVLRSVPEAAEISYYESSRKRRNRRYGLDFPGEKVVRKCSVIVGFDVSGSMYSDDVMSRLGNVLDEIAEKAEVKVLFFDHAIQKEIDYEKGCLSAGIPGGGGTLFKPVFDRATELNADALIMLTDGIMGDRFDRPHYPTVWGLLEGFEGPVEWGQKVVLK